jgi:hypothetical protein
MRLRYPDPSPNLHALQPVSVRRLQSCTITAAAEKTTAAFFMGFPLVTKIKFDGCVREGHPERLTEFHVDERPLV